MLINMQLQTLDAQDAEQRRALGSTGTSMLSGSQKTSVGRNDGATDGALQGGSSTPPLLTLIPSCFLRSPGWTTLP